METKYKDIIYHNNVNLDKAIKRAWALQNEILLLLDMKEISHDFVTKINVRNGDMK